MSSLPMLRTGRAWMGFIAVFAAMFLFSYTPFVSWTVSLLYLLGPCAIFLCLQCAGLLPASAAAVFAVGSYAAAFGGIGAACYAAFLLPVCAGYAVCVRRKVTFLKTVGIVAGLLALSQTGVFLALDSMTENGLFTAAGEMTRKYITDAEFGDLLLYMLYRSGLLPLNESIAENMVASSNQITGFVLSETARNELILSLTNYVSTLAFTLAPAMLVGHSIMTGIAGVSFSLYRGQVHQERVAFRYQQEETGADPAEDAKNPPVDILGMPGLSKWHLPRGWGLRIGILGLGYFLSYTSQNMLQLLGMMFYSVYSAVFTVQGAAALYSIQKMRGRKKTTRTVVLVLLYCLLPQVLRILGLIDQMTDFRHLRIPDDEKDGPADRDDDLF